MYRPVKIFLWFLNDDDGEKFSIGASETETVPKCESSGTNEIEEKCKFINFIQMKPQI